MDFKTKLLESLKDREECKGCPLYGKPIVLYETSYEETEDNRADVMFFGINPGRPEVKEGRPFMGSAGQLLREKLEKLHFFDEFKVAFTHTIFCSTLKEKDIPDIESCMANCKSILRDIVLHLRPRIFVTVGRNCSEHLFAITGPILKISGRKYGTNDNLIPLLHPSALLYNRTTENETVFDESLKNIRKYIKNAPKDLMKKKKKVDSTAS